MSGKDVCLVTGTAAVCGIFWYFWTKRQAATPASLPQSDSSSRPSAQHILGNAEEYARLTTPASLPQSDSSSRTSAQHLPGNAEEYARLNSITTSKSEEQQISSLNCNDLEEDRDPVGGQWFDAVIVHALEDKRAARLCQKILLEEINVPNLQIGLPDDIITPGTSTLDGLGSLISNCRLVIIYHSRFLSMDGFMLFWKQANIIQSLEDPQKRDRIIPFIVDGENLSLDMCTIHPINYVNDIRSANFPSFKNKMERLFLMWREKIA